MFVGNIVGVLLMEEYFEIDEMEDKFMESGWIVIGYLG